MNRILAGLTNDWTGEVWPGVMMVTIAEMINNGDKDPPYVVLSRDYCVPRPLSS